MAVFFKRFIYLVCSLLVLSVFSGSLFAQESEEENEDPVYSQIDMAFEVESADLLTHVLADNRNSTSYGQYEEYVLDKTRDVIIENNLSFAMEATLAVIDNNLQNFEAVDMYSAIYKAVSEEKALQQRKKISTAWTR